MFDSAFGQFPALDSFAAVDGAVPAAGNTEEPVAACAIPPGANYTYRFQTKDQIGTFFYFPSLALHRAGGGFGALNVYQRPAIPVPYPPLAGDFTLLVGDWYAAASHAQLRQTLDAGGALPPPDALLIDGVRSGSTLVGNGGGTYLFRVSNVGLRPSVNVRIQGHQLEVEGTHPVQNVYDALDVHPGQSLVLVTLDQPPLDYAVVASTRFTPVESERTAVATLHYAGATARAPGPLPPALAPFDYGWSLNQTRSFRWNLTASTARPNPQGSFHYGAIPTSRTLVLASSSSAAEPDNSHDDNAAADTVFASSDAYLGVDLDFARCMDGIKAIGVPVAPPELDMAAGSFFYPNTP